MLERTVVKGPLSIASTIRYCQTLTAQYWTWKNKIWAVKQDCEAWEWCQGATSCLRISYAPEPRQSVPGKLQWKRKKEDWRWSSTICLRERDHRIR